MKRTLWGLAFVAIMVIGMALPVQAASFKVGGTDFTLGGSVRLDTGWRFSDYGDINEGVDTYDLDEDGTPDLNFEGISDKDDFFLENPGDSRLFIGAVNGKMNAYAEIGVATEGLSTRHIYAAYDLGKGNSLLFGQTWTPVAEDSPAQVLFYDDGMQYFGDLYTGRRPQIRFEHSKDNMTLKVALQEAVTDFESVGYDAEDVLPGLCLSMGFGLDNLSITPSLYLQTYTLKALDDSGPFSDDIDVTTYVLALNAALKLGEATLSGELWWGQNVAAAFDVASGARNTDFGMPAFDYNDAGSDINDVNSYGGWVQLSASLKPGTLACGAGYQNAEVEYKGAGFESDVSTWGVFANYTYPITAGFSVTPEILYVNYGNAPVKYAGGNDLGTDLFVGVHFQYDF